MYTKDSKKGNKKEAVFENNESIQKGDDLRDQNHADNPSIATEVKVENIMKKIDFTSLFLFPIVFLSFIVVYLVVFLK